MLGFQNNLWGLGTEQEPRCRCRLCGLADRYDNPIPIDYSKIPAQYKLHLSFVLFPLQKIANCWKLPQHSCQ
jgi:hypothetical protein